MAIKEKFKNLLQLSMLLTAEIKEQINDGDMDLLQELNEKICRLLGNLKAWSRLFKKKCWITTNR